MLYIFLILLVILVVLKIFYSKKEKITNQPWWNSNPTVEDKYIDSLKKDIDDTIDSCSQKPSHYIETSNDDFSEISINNGEVKIPNINLKFKNGTQKNIIKKYGTYKNNLEKPNSERTPNEKSYVGDSSIKDMLSSIGITGWQGKKGTAGSSQINVYQGKEIDNNYLQSFDKENNSKVNDLKDNINTLEDYYKYQILKKKNYVNSEIAEEDYLDQKKINGSEYDDTRFIDKSDGRYYDGEKYIFLPGHKEENIGLKELSTINKIGFSDLFGKPHNIQKKTDNLVSRSFHSEDPVIQNVIKNGKSIIGSSNCESNKECYPTDSTTKLPLLTSASCKPCPVGLISTYEFTKPGSNPVKYFGNIGGFYTGKGNPDDNKDSLTTIKKNNKDGYEVCKLCDYQAGCRYDEIGRPRDTHFEAQSCVNGNNRICKPCRICKMGTEYVTTGCGEGGIAQDTECGICSKCKEGTFKVAGCSNYNSFLDTYCVKSSDCIGKPTTTDKNDPNYYEDPGEGNRYYMTKEGYPGGHKFGGKGYKDGSGEDDFTPGEELPNPYFGKDRSCRKCDTCPEGTKMIGDGCVGYNSNKNTTCQRLIPVDKYVDKLQTCEKGKFFNRALLKEKLTYNFEAPSQTDNIDQRVLDFYNKDIEIRNKLEEEGKNVNDLKYYLENPIPNFSDDDIKQMACVECKKCEPGTFKNPKNGGCIADNNTICLKKTDCKPYEILLDEGDHLTDRSCGSCKCPPDKFGIAVCKDNQIVSGCETRTQCKEDEFKFDNPVQYNNVTKDTICKKCKKCPPNSFELAKCKDSTDTVCKNHKICGPNQYVVKKGTDISDTICKCLDGYELPKDEFGMEQIDAPDCIPSKGKCWSNPCHPNSKCYDRFDANGKFIEYVCRCNNEEGYIETELLGVGQQGCRKIPTKHSHNQLGLAPAIDYGLSDKINQIMTHTDSDYHKKLESYHIHKNKNIIKDMV